MRQNEKIMLDTLNCLRKVKDLVNTYDGNDAPIYRRKLAQVSERVEEVVKAIRDKEERGLAEAKRSMNRLSEGNGDPEEMEKVKSLIISIGKATAYAQTRWRS